MAFKDRVNIPGSVSISITLIKRAIQVSVLLWFLYSPNSFAETFKRPLVFGVNPEAEYGLFKDDTTYRELVWQRLEEAGCRAARLEASWQIIEAERGKRDWTTLDAGVNQARRIGAEPVLMIIGTPGWASPTGKPTGEYPPKEEMAEEFQNFCAELAGRYKGLVQYYEFWNKENSSGWHADQGFLRADEYIPWLRRASQSLKGANPDCKVALGGLSDEDGYAWAYLKKFYRFRNEWFPGEDFLDAVAIHPAADLDAFKGNHTKLREVMAENGDGQKPLWFTEYGWSLRNLTLEEQAASLKSFLDVITLSEYDDIQIAAYRSIAVTDDGLCDANLRPRPAFQILRDHPLSERPFSYALMTEPLGSGALRLRWRTRSPASSRIEFISNETIAGQSAETPAAVDHDIEMRDLPPGARFQIRAAARISDDSEQKTAFGSLLIPGPGVWNGDFEGGITAGIGIGWTLAGNAYCYDSSQPFLKLMHSGSQAQVLNIKSGEDHNSGVILCGKACVTKGKRYQLSAWTVVPGGDSLASLSRQVGADPTGASDPASAAILWSTPANTLWSWSQNSLEFVTDADVISVYVRILTGASPLSEEAFIYIDDVQVREAGAN